jgi:hypothetical protein
MMNTGNGIVSWNDTGADNAGLGEDHMIAKLTGQSKTVRFKDFDELAIRNGAKLV